MTAITPRSVRDTRDVAAGAAEGDSLLRFALRADATLCGALGLFIAMAAGARGVRGVGVGVLVGNIAFTVLVTVVLIAGWLPLTGLGVASTIAFTVATLAFAYAQYLGVRRLA